MFVACCTGCIVSTYLTVCEADWLGWSVDFPKSDLIISKDNTACLASPLPSFSLGELISNWGTKVVSFTEQALQSPISHACLLEVNQYLNNHYKYFEHNHLLEGHIWQHAAKPGEQPGQKGLSVCYLGEGDNDSEDHLCSENHLCTTALHWWGHLFIQWKHWPNECPTCIWRKARGSP